MKFSFGAILALAAAVLAKPQFTNSHYEVQEDVPFTLTWSNADGPVTISLMAGPSGNLKKVTDLASGVTGNSVPVTLSNLPSGQYAFRITDSTNDPNYSPQFEYAGTATASPSDSTTTVSSTTNSSSSTSTSSVSTTSNTSTVTSSSSQSSASTTAPSTTSSTSTTRQSPTAPSNSNNGQRFASPLALVLVTVAALVFFN